MGLLTDREKVIKGLEHCTAMYGLYDCQPKDEEDCPYVDEPDCRFSIMHDALALLKEQEKEIKRLKLEWKIERLEVIRAYDDREAAKWDD